jgi:hypothetical protein
MGFRRWVAVVSVAALTLYASAASAERYQEGNLIVTLNGGISPLKLPRNHPVPVAVRLSGSVLTADQAPLPRVNWIKLELAWRGVLDTKGLANCPSSRLEFAETKLAVERCQEALVGRGDLFAQVFVTNQEPFDVHAKIVAFNGRTKSGRHAVLVHAYSTDPPVSFVIPFSVHRKKGSFRTVLVALIRREVGPWPRVANFHIAVSRTFTHNGRKHSYLQASCPIPKTFTAGFLSFARATYSFDGGEELTTEAVRSCRAR